MTETVNTSRWTIDRWEDRGAGRVLTGAFVGMIALVLIATAYLVWESLQSTIRTYQDRQSRMATVLAEQANRDFRAVDMALDEIADNIAASSTGMAIRSAEALEADAQRLLAHLPQIEALILTAANGEVLHSSRPLLPGLFEASAAEAIQHFRQAKEDELYFGTPAPSEPAGLWVIPVSRSVVVPGGQLTGVVTAAVSTKHFEDFYQSVDHDEAEVLSLVRRDGTILVHHPYAKGALGRRLPEQSPWFATAAAGGGLYEGRPPCIRCAIFP
jgi:hypothetical protein